MSFSCLIALWKHTCWPIKRHVLSKLFCKIWWNVQYIRLIVESCLAGQAEKSEKWRSQFTHQQRSHVFTQSYHGQWKVGEKRHFFKVREKSVNFVFGQGNLEFCSKSGKVILYKFGYFKFFLTFIERQNKRPEKYVKHVVFSVQLPMFKVSEICSRSGKSQGIFFVLM